MKPERAMKLLLEIVNKIDKLESEKKDLNKKKNSIDSIMDDGIRKQSRGIELLNKDQNKIEKLMSQISGVTKEIKKMREIEYAIIKGIGEFDKDQLTFDEAVKIYDKQQVNTAKSLSNSDIDKE
jgi:hypothetical protein